MALLFKCDQTDPQPWLDALSGQLPAMEVRLYPDIGSRETVEYALVYEPPRGLLGTLPGLRAVFSLWAGVDHLGEVSSLPAVPVVRMVDPGMTAAMTEYVVHKVLTFHIGSLEYSKLQTERVWEQRQVSLAADRPVGIMGLGIFGIAVAEKLTALGFDVAGWSRTEKKINGVHCFHGDEGLSPFLQRSSILVCLLPLTTDTRGILNSVLFERLKTGAFIINCARGGHLVEADLLNSLEQGQIAAAALDVFETEPLPADHPFWAHPRIIVTPHVAAACFPETAVASVVQNIRRIEAGEAPLYVVDFERGY